MRQKVSITLSIPIRFKRIANGEKLSSRQGPMKSKSMFAMAGWMAHLGLRC